MLALRIRTGAIVGLVGAALLIVAGLVGGSLPKPDAPTSSVVAYLVDKRTAIRWQLVLFALAIVLLLWFLAAFGTLVARSGAISPIHAAVPLVGMGALAGIALGGAAPLAAVVWRGHPEGAIAQLAWDANNLATSFVGTTGLVVFAAAGLLVLRSGALPRWVGWLGLLAAALNLLAVLSILVDADHAVLAPGGVLPGIVTLLVAALWIIAAGVCMLAED